MLTWCTMPVDGGTTRRRFSDDWPQRRNSKRSALRSNSSSEFFAAASGRAEEVDLHRVVDHEVGRAQRVDPLGIAAELGHGVAHHREVHDRRHAGQVLQHHPRGAEGDLGVVLARRRPARERRDVVAGDGDAVLVPQQVLEQHADRARQARHRAEPRLFDRRQPVDPEALRSDLDAADARASGHRPSSWGRTIATGRRGRGAGCRRRRTCARDPRALAWRRGSGVSRLGRETGLGVPALPIPAHVRRAVVPGS